MYPKSLPVKEKQLAANQCDELCLKSSRGDRTSVELFLAGVVAMESHIHQLLLAA